MTDAAAVQSKMQTKPVPRGWGDGPLTAYLDDYHDNQVATFANKRKQVADLIRIDSLILKLLQGAINPRPFVPMTFMLRAHAAYRAAAGAVMAGQLYEAQTLMRLCLEHAAYGFYIGSDVQRWERWMGRNDNAANKKVVREEFQHGKIKAHITDQSKSLGERFGKLYDRLIDFGAHPNEQGFSLNSAIRKDGDSVHFDTVYLQGGGFPLDFALKTLGQVGLWVLFVMQPIYKERYELLGIRAEMDEIRRRF